MKSAFVNSLQIEFLNDEISFDNFDDHIILLIDKIIALLIQAKKATK